MLISPEGAFCVKYIEAGKMTYACIIFVGVNGTVLYTLPTLVDISKCNMVDYD